MMGMCRKRNSSIINYYQWCPRRNDIPYWIEEAFNQGILFYSDTYWSLKLKSEGKDHTIYNGNYIIKDDDGTLLSCDNYLFDKSYERVEEEEED